MSQLSNSWNRTSAPAVGSRPVSAIAVEDLSKSFPTGDGSAVLSGVNIRVEAGEMVAVVGPSGSGKSTALHCISGLLPPSNGRVYWAGNVLPFARRRTLERMRRQQSTFIFQNLNLISSLTVEDNIVLQLRLNRVSHDRRQIHSAAERLGIERLLRAYPDELSGGQQQRVAVCRAIVTPSRYVFADEPTSALDRESSASVIGELRTMASDGRSVLLVTHDIDAACHAHRVLVLVDGKIRAEILDPRAADVFAAMER